MPRVHSSSVNLQAYTDVIFQLAAELLEGAAAYRVLRLSNDESRLSPFGLSVCSGAAVRCGKPVRANAGDGQTANRDSLEITIRPEEDSTGMHAIWLEIHRDSISDFDESQIAIESKNEYENYRFV